MTARRVAAAVPGVERVDDADGGGAAEEDVVDKRVLDVEEELFQDGNGKLCLDDVRTVNDLVKRLHERSTAH